MVKKEFMYYGRSIEDVKKMSIGEFAELVPSRIRRSLKRGLTEQQKILLEKIKKGEDNLKTHCRDMVIVPEMVGKTISVFNGKEYTRLTITGDMLGHFLGEFSMTRKSVAHSAPGIGATRSSAAMSVK